MLNPDISENYGDIIKSFLGDDTNHSYYYASCGDFIERIQMLGTFFKFSSVSKT